MKCPKCGHDNADGDIFCSECDWQLNKAYNPETKVQKVVVTTYVGLVFGVAALIVALMDFGIFGAVFGAIGMIASSYSMTLVRVSDIQEDKKKIMIGATALSLVASVIGFIIGFTGIF